MTPDDIAQAAVDLDLYRRAAARCSVSVPHRDAGEDVPCSGCLLAAATQLAIASDLSALASSSSIAVRRSDGGDDGAADRASAVPTSAAPPSVKSNRPGTVNPEPAEGATAIARKQVTE